jgi:hypothetical protein
LYRFAIRKFTDDVLPAIQIPPTTRIFEFSFG